MHRSRYKYRNGYIIREPSIFLGSKTGNIYRGTGVLFKIFLYNSNDILLEIFTYAISFNGYDPFTKIK